MSSYIGFIIAKLRQIENLVMQLFELLRLDAVDFKPEEEPFIFSEILQEVIHSFSMAADAKQITLICKGCDELAWTQGDIKMMDILV